jgi:hypothetical protein
MCINKWPHPRESEWAHVCVCVRVFKEAATSSRAARAIAGSIPTPLLIEYTNTQLLLIEYNNTQRPRHTPRGHRQPWSKLDTENMS